MKIDLIRWSRVGFLAVVDAILIMTSSILALFLRVEFSLTDLLESGFLTSVIHALPANIFCTLILFWLFQLYQSLWEFAGVEEMVRIVIASGLSSAMTGLFMFVFSMPAPRSYPVLYFLILTLLTMAFRLSYRFLRSLRRPHAQPTKRTMLIGAGAAGAAVLRDLQQSAHSENKVVCCIDDDPLKRGTSLRGVPVVGGRDKIQQAVEKYQIQEILFAIPSAPARTRREILNCCQQTPCTLKILPGIYQLVGGQVSIRKIRHIEIEDLLGRDAVHVDMTGIGNHLRDKTILVTGGGGSIGSELCRQIASYGPRRLVIFDIYENNAYDVQMELQRKYPELDLKVLIGSVRDRERLAQVFSEERPQLVYHAAAHKHVPLMEESPAEAVKNNVFGTKNAAELAAEYGAERFLLISTDKAVNPTNVMGATKRVCEMVIQQAGRHSKTEFVAVRFGNVLGSNGSVIPLFKKQIAAGGPVTVTDPNIIRYFMTIPEAVSLVLQAGVFAKGGEIFILDMGDPVRIDDLARNMIRLSGFEPDVDIAVEYTGLRPGEKLFEELLLDGEGHRKTENNLIYIGRDEAFDDEMLSSELLILRDAADRGDGDAVRETLARLVPTYRLPAVRA